jgi:hypothetical protein
MPMASPRRDHFIPNIGGPRGTWFRKGQVLVSRAQLALAVVDAPCQRPGEATTCASYVETTWVADVSSLGRLEVAAALVTALR